jgi:8-amino-7-oxononanoate synthase
VPTISDANSEIAAPSSLEGALSQELAALERAGLRRTLRPLHGRTGARVAAGTRVLHDFSSNDYLGLAADPRLANAAALALGTAGTGAGAARLISGHHELHDQLEQVLARFTGRDAALLFPSGYSANVGAIPALVGRGDAIFSDFLNHASLIDACRLSRADVHVVPHADLAALGRALERQGAGRYRRRLIVVEGIYSMDGDLYPLDALVPLARRYDAWIYLDDAHAVGVLGPSGRGSAEHWGVAQGIDVVMGTLGKACGVAGAFVAGSRSLVDYLTNRARAFVYTTGSPPALAAAALTALDIMGQEPERRVRLRANARRLRAGLTARGRPSPGPEDGHIVPVMIGASDATMGVGAALEEAGFLVGAIRPPTVPDGTARLRITVSAAHDAPAIDALLDALSSALPPAP